MIDDDRQTRQARRDLERIDRESGFAGTSVMKSKSRSLGAHFAARDADQNDPIEVRATRIGRLLSLAAVIGLIAWLIYSYA